jgi:hypothetical protein
MADLTITAASVLAGEGASIQHTTSGDTVTAGKVVYRDTATKRQELADSNSGTALAKRPNGIALNGASDGQPLAIVTSGPVTIGATLVAGAAYYLSDTPGGICPFADLATGEDVVQIGNAISTTVLDVDIKVTKVTLA